MSLVTSLDLLHLHDDQGVPPTCDNHQPFLKHHRPLTSVQKGVGVGVGNEGDSERRKTQQCLVPAESVGAGPLLLSHHTLPDSSGKGQDTYWLMTFIWTL